VNWWVTQAKGDKISKSQVSKGGAEPIPDAAEKYTVDGMRLYYTHVGSADLDIEWDQSTVLHYKSRLYRIWEVFQEVHSIINSAGDGENVNANKDQEIVDQWLVNAVNQRVKVIVDALEKYDLRAASNEIYFGLFQDVRWYLRRGGANSKILKQIVETWIRLLSPATPFIAEELWEMYGFSKNTDLGEFVSLAEFPQFDTERQNPLVEMLENYLRSVVNDIHEINKVVKIKLQKVIIYTSPAWKFKMRDIAHELVMEGKLEMSTLMQHAMAVQEIKAQAKVAPGFAQQLLKELQKHGGKSKETAEEVKGAPKIDEMEYLSGTINFLKNNFGCDVQVFSADDKDAPDPGNKMKQAIPLRPAIYIE